VNSGKTLFAQLMDFLPWSTFTRIVARYGGDQRVRTLSVVSYESIREWGLRFGRIFANMLRQRRPRPGDKYLGR
jgi:hypothetical protein